jgi:hypothetical protein
MGSLVRGTGIDVEGGNFMPNESSIGFSLIDIFISEHKNHVCELTEAAQHSDTSPRFEIWFQVEFALWLRRRGVHRRTIGDSNYVGGDFCVDKNGIRYRILSYKRESSHHLSSPNNIDNSRADFSIIFDTPYNDKDRRAVKEIIELKHNALADRSSRENLLNHKVNNIDSYGECGKFAGIEFSLIIITSTASKINIKCDKHEEHYKNIPKRQAGKQANESIPPSLPPRFAQPSYNETYFRPHDTFEWLTYD